jgi:hypothetical protein
MAGPATTAIFPHLFFRYRGLGRFFYYVYGGFFAGGVAAHEAKYACAFAGSFWGFDLYTFLAHDDEVAFFDVSDRFAGRGFRVGVYDGDFVYHGSADIHLPLR